MLQPADICEHWEAIKPTLQIMLDSSAEELYAACVSGEAVLLKAPEGFVVVTEQTSRDGRKDLFVWAVAGRGGHFYRRYWPDLADMAKHLGCAAVTGRVREERVGELLEHHGWKRTYIEYSREVQ